MEVTTLVSEYLRFLPKMGILQHPDHNLRNHSMVSMISQKVSFQAYCYSLIRSLFLKQASKYFQTYLSSKIRLKLRQLKKFNLKFNQLAILF